VTNSKGYYALFTSPRLRKLAKELNISHAAAIGHTVALIEWARTYTPDGIISKYENEYIAAGALYEGNAAAFINARLECEIAEETGYDLFLNINTTGTRLPQARG
jgi:hypothetical protein